jgi:hypothetical protein
MHRTTPNHREEKVHQDQVPPTRRPSAPTGRSVLARPKADVSDG